MRTKMKLAIGFLMFSAIAVVHQSNANAQSFIFAGEGNGLDVIAHPSGYNGTGGTLTVTVGIDPTSVNAADMVISTQNVIRTWNQQVVTTGNISFGLPSNDFDFESVLLHEMGHSLGFGHVNLGSQPGVSGSNTDYSYSSDGADNVFTFGAGVDGVIGSSDDVRGDDANLNYFNSLNDPFALDASGIIDSTTYSRDLADLPVGHLYAANSSRDVAALLGYGATEGVMQQGTFFNEIQRSLAASDVAALRYAESGVDELAGTADDYDLEVQYVTWDGSLGTRPDIVIDFDGTQTGFAVSQSGGTFIGGTDHIAITSNSIYFDPGDNWYFNTVSAVPEPGHLSVLAILGSVAFFRRRKRV